MDKVSQSRIELLHPKIKNEVIQLVNAANIQLSGRAQMRITQGLRTIDEQNKLFNQVPKVTKARGGQSFHNYGLAFDFCLIIDGKDVSWDMLKDYDGDKIADWMEVVKIFKAAKYEWGGDWKFTDNPHFQKVFGHTWQQLIAKYTNKDFIKGTTYVNI